MKKVGALVLLALLACVLIWNFSGAALVGGNLACDDELGCSGAASCNNKGTRDGCNLHCADGPVVVCNTE